MICIGNGAILFLVCLFVGPVLVALAGELAGDVKRLIHNDVGGKLMGESRQLGCDILSLESSSGHARIHLFLLPVAILLFVFLLNLR